MERLAAGLSELLTLRGTLSGGRHGAVIDGRRAKRRDPRGAATRLLVLRSRPPVQKACLADRVAKFETRRAHLCNSRARWPRRRDGPRPLTGRASRELPRRHVSAKIVDPLDERRDLFLPPPRRELRER